jgi:3D (Asp-Asp-Asp) domain-containing protein
MFTRLTGLSIAFWLVAQASGGEPGFRRVIVTAYCPCAICCGHWALKPNERRNTLSPQLSIAGPRRYPLGTQVWIEGIGQRVIQDRTAQRYDHRFDLYFTNHAQAKAFGKRVLKIKILDEPSPRRPQNRPAEMVKNARPPDSAMPGNSGRELAAQ